MSEIARGRDGLRHWWAAPALAILIMLGSWVWAERPRVDVGDSTIDARFILPASATLREVDSEGTDAWLRLDWRSDHDGDIRWSELDVRAEGSTLRYVGHDPAAGEWSALRDDVYLSSAGRARDDDIIVVGEAARSGARVELVVDPVDRVAAATVLG